jgi:hypothetical protein
LLLAGIFLVPVYSNAQAPAKPRTDALGDPLPLGAVARLGTLRFKHNPAGNQPIDTALISPDGTKIASMVSSAGSIRLWDAASGKEISGPWTSANRYCTAVAFSPDSTLLRSASIASPPADGVSDTGVLQKRWDALAQNGAATAFTAILDFVATSKESLAWINRNASKIRSKGMRWFSRT